MKEGSFDKPFVSNEVKSALSQDLALNLELDQMDFANVKTPDQIPDPLDFSHLPESALRSNAMEAVIQQNEDLMSRLSVSLRRISYLEDKVKEVTAESETFRTRHDNLKDQLLVLKEQAKRLASKNEITAADQILKDKKTEELKEQVRILEIRYAELFQSNRAKRQELEDERSRFDRILARYRVYRQKIVKLSKNIRTEFRELKAKKAQQDVTMAGLKQNLLETTEYITQQGQNHKREMRELTDSYEGKLKAAEAETQMLVEQNRVLGERAKEFDRIQTERYRIENDLIIAQRREEELRKTFEDELHEVQASLAKYRAESKQLAIDLAAKINTCDELTAANEELRGANNAFAEQTETLQALWSEQRTKIENLTEQKSSLQRLNQELSVTVNKLRLEIRELKEKYENQATEHDEALKRLDLENKLQKSQSILQKIDRALGGIHEKVEAADQEL